MLHSSAAALSGLEGDNVVLVFRVHGVKPADQLNHAFDATRDARNRDEAQDFADLARALSNTEYGGLLEPLEAEDPSVYVSTAAVDDDVVRSAPLLLGFYYLGLITIHRIDRGQARARIRHGGKADPVALDTIAKMRVRLLNVDRYFLTTNRSNDATAKTFCIDRMKSMDLAGRYARQHSILESFERFLDTSAQLDQSASARRTNHLVILLTALSVPVALFSALVAFQYDSPAVKSLPGTASTAPFWSVWGVSAAVTLALVGVAFLLTSLASRRQAS